MKLPELSTPLTVIVQFDNGAELADKDLEKALGGDLILSGAVSEMYFHQLRLRVAEDPTLAKKITVYHRNKDGKLEGPIGLRKGEANGPDGWWPVGFLNCAWEIESEITRVNHIAALEK